MSNPNIGPSAISDPGTPGGPGFILSKTEWISIQTYVIDALALPTTEDAFRKSLGPGAPSSLADFEQLIEAYKTINAHCSTWQNTTFPNTVSLASNVYEYGTQKAPVYYPPILKEASILTNDPENKAAKAALKAILDSLSTTAKDYAVKAAQAEAEIKTFADGTQSDKSTLIGNDGKSGLLKFYKDKYGDKSAEVVELNKEIKAQRIILNAANKEYDHDVVVAATTPTYAWFWPIGTIAAAIVAGIYGDKAVKALNRAKAAQDKINSLAADLAADANLMTVINSAELGLTTISTELAAALPVIQKIQGVWGGIADDLANIVTIIDQDIRKALPIIMNLGVDEAMKAWKSVALAANQYRINAYVTEESHVGIQKEFLNLERTVAMAKAKA